MPHSSRRPGIVAGEPPALAAQEVDQALVLRMRGGDTAAFAAVFRVYYPVLVRALTRYGAGVDAAEDVAQEVFSQVWEDRAAIDVDRSLKSYLYMLGRNKVFNLLKHEGIVRRYAQGALTPNDDARPPSAAPAADAALLADELAQVVKEHVSTLSPRQREIYYLSREEGLSANEIAEVLGIAAQTVYVQLGRVIRTLYPVLEPWVKDRP